MTTLGPKAEMALELLREVVAGICAHPDLMQMEVRNGQVLEIAITAHPTDSRRLVGKRRSHFNAIGALASLMLDGTGRRVTLLPVRSLDLPEDDWRELVVNPEWDRAGVERLIRGLVDAVFPAVRYQVEIVQHDQRSSRIEIIMPEVEEWHGAIRVFAEALAVTFVPFGSQLGQCLYVNVRTGASDEELDRGRDRARGAAGPVRAAGVPRGKPDARDGAQGRSNRV